MEHPRPDDKNWTWVLENLLLVEVSVYIHA
jgi:hypothetical protein